MATVTGLTAERMLAIEAASVVGGTVVGDELHLTTHDGTIIDAGSVRGPQGVVGPTGPPGSAIAAWPVGSIFMAVVATNPNTLLGGGTWVAWGTGRVPVAIDTGQTEFATVEHTGGEKTHAMTTAEMPTHTHGITTGHGGPGSSSGGRASDYTSTGTGVVSADTANTDSAGSGAAHNNLQPYITCYMWKRTA